MLTGLEGHSTTYNHSTRRIFYSFFTGFKALLSTRVSYNEEPKEPPVLACTRKFDHFKYMYFPSRCTNMPPQKSF